MDQRGNISFMDYLSKIHKSWEIIAEYSIHTDKEGQHLLSLIYMEKLDAQLQEEILLGNHLIKLRRDMVNVIITNKNSLEFNKRKVLILTSLSGGLL